MYTPGNVPTVIGGSLPRCSLAGVGSSTVLHPTLLKGMAKSIGANIFTNTAITRTANLITPTTVVGSSNMAGVAGVTGVTNMTNVIGEIPGTH
jgi:hypothetical protein